MTDPLADIRQYSPTMTISQVIKFCEKKGLGITRAMVQNYIRAGLLPPPVNKRLYTHKHLALLALVDRLKTVFEIPAIAAALAPYTDDEGLPLEIYSEILTITGALTDKLAESGADAAVLMSCAARIKEIAAEGGTHARPYSYDTRT